jgi:hypothetical protein
LAASHNLLLIHSRVTASLSTPSGGTAATLLRRRH